MRRRAPILALVALSGQALPANPAAGAASAWSDHEVVAVRLIAGTQAEGDRGAGEAAPELRLGLHYRLAPDWHVYWVHPGDAGAPPEVAVTAEGEGERRELASRLLFPAPHRIRLPGGLEALGYEREVVYPLRVRGTVAGLGPTSLAVSVDYVACAVECIPYHDDLEISGLGVSPSDEEELLGRWEAEVPRALDAVPGVSARLVYRGGAAPELVLELSGPPLAGAQPELFLEPAAGVTFASPALVREGTTARFRAAVRPEVVDALPPRLAVAWTVTGLRRADPEAPGRLAVTARTEVEAGGERRAGAGGVGRTGDDPREEEAPRNGGLLGAFLAGALLGLNPTGIAVLVLLAARPLDARRRSVPPLLAAAALSASLACLQAVARTRGVAAPLEEPATVVVLVLPALALALLLWVAPAAVERRAPAMIAILAPVLAAPAALVWLPLTGWSAAPPLSVATAISVGFALPFLGGALGAARAPTLSPRLLAGLGFVAALTPLWAAYRLALVLPAHRLAGIELSWVALALALRAGATSSGPGRAIWLVAAIASAGVGVWLA